MFGKHARDAQLFGHLVHQLYGGQSLLSGHTSGGLIQQQQLGLAGQGNRQLQTLLISMGQRFGGSGPLRGQTHALEQVFGTLNMQTTGCSPDFPSLLRMCTQCHLHVFQDRHAMKHTGDLKGAPHAQPGQSMGCKPGHIASVKGDVALIGL